MNATQVISVNPGKKTIGELLLEARDNEPATHSIVATVARKPKGHSIMNALTGISSKASQSTSRRLLFLRVITATILGGLAWYSWYAGAEPMLFIPLIVLGGSLLTGFLTRIVSIGMLGTFVYFAFLGFAAPVISGALAFTALVFAILGPGRYSIDQLIRHTAISAAKRRNSIPAAPRSAYPHLKFDYRSYSHL